MDCNASIQHLRLRWPQTLTWMVCVPLLGALLTAQAAPAKDVDALLECAGKNSPDKTFEQALTFKVLRDGSERTIESKVYGLREDSELRLNFRIESPPDLAGTAVLIRERKGQDSMELYLPSLRRSRKITGRMAATKLFGTDFSYLDIKQIFGAFLDGPRRYDSSVTFAGREADRVHITPAQEESAPFQSLAATIDRKTCVVLAVDFFDEEQTLIKQLAADIASLATIDGRHIAKRYTLKDLQQNSSTQITLSDIEYDQRLSRSIFDPKLFQDAR